MNTKHVGGIGRVFQSLMESGALGGLSDGELVERLGADQRSLAEAAFEALIDRHGDMVYRVCRGYVDDVEDAHDAFQATFLVLLRTSDSIHRTDSVGSWLHGVACRIAKRLRTDRSRRQVAEHRCARQAEHTTEDARRSTLCCEVREHVRRLPEKYRDVMVLCDLEELTYEEAAQRLRIPSGTIKSRLARARGMLKTRLMRHGFALPVGVTVAVLMRTTTVEAMPPILREAVTQLATIEVLAKFGAAPARAMVLSSWMLRVIVLAKLQSAALLLLFLGLATTGAYCLATWDPPRKLVKREHVQAQQAPVVPKDMAFEQALTAIEQCEDGERKADGLLSLAKWQIDQGMRDEARKTLQRAVAASSTLRPEDWKLHLPDRTIERSTRPQHTLVRIAMAQEQAGDHEAARGSLKRMRAIIHELKDDDQRGFEMRAVAMVFVALGDRAAAENIQIEAKQMALAVTDTKVKSRVEGYLAVMRADLGDIGGALKAFSEIKPVDTSWGVNFTLLRMVEAVGSPGRVEITQNLESIWWALDGIASGHGRALVQRTIVETLAQRGDLESALRLAVKMDNGKLLDTDEEEPRRVFSEKLFAYEAIAQAQGTAGNLAAAQEMFGLVLRELETRDPTEVFGDWQGLKTEMGIIQAEIGDLEGAFTTATKVRARTSRSPFVYEAVARGYEKTGDKKSAHDMLDTAVEAQKEWVTAVQKMGRIAELMEATLAWFQLRAGNLEEALRAVDGMNDASWRGQAYGMLAQLEGETGNVGSVLKW